MARHDESWRRVLESFTRLDFTPAQHARYADLALKAQDGVLTPDETAEIHLFLEANSLLAVLQSKARIALRENRQDE